jgi:hypothetical protein
LLPVVVEVAQFLLAVVAAVAVTENLLPNLSLLESLTPLLLALEVLERVAQTAHEVLLALILF